MTKLAAPLAAFAAISAIWTADACTGLYVGRKVSVEGNTLIGRTIDSGDAYVSKSIHIFPRVENRPGRFYSSGFSCGGWPLPATTWKFISTPVASIQRDIRYDSACVTEKGLIISGTVTGKTNEKARKADPFVKSGFGESSVVGLLAQCCTTARQAVELLGEAVAARGHDGAEIYMFADKDEAWYAEVYTGHQWAAVKMPEDKVLVIGNQFMIGEFDPSSGDVLSSPDLVTLPEKAGFAKKGPNGLIDLAATYGTERNAYSNIRTWFGHTVFAPHDGIGDFTPEREYPLFYTPSRKISKRDMFELMRSRYEGTKYCPEESGDDSIRVIGTVRQSSCHVLELDADLPEEKRATMWVTMAHAEHAPYIPISSAATAIDTAYSLFTSDAARAFDSALAAHSFRRLGVLAETDRKFHGEGVRKYWRDLEDAWLDGFSLVVEDGDAEEITAYCLEAQRRALEDARGMFDELNWYIVRHSVKKGDSPTKRIPAKEPFRYSLKADLRTPGPRFAVVEGGVLTNGSSISSRELAKAAENAGFTAILIPHSADRRRIAAVMGMADALLIGGANSKDSWKKRLDFDIALIEEAVKRRLPVLGFCHGHQVINMAFGGSIGLIPKDRRPKVTHIKLRPFSRNNFHMVDIEKDSWLHTVTGTNKLEVNSSHKYEIVKVGKGLKVSARAADGTVEAIEHEDLPITGFQFHPETIGNRGEIYTKLIREALQRD